MPISLNPKSCRRCSVFWFTFALKRGWWWARQPLGAVIRYWWYWWGIRKHDPEICCCGDMIGCGGSICHHGGCRSALEYALTCRKKELGLQGPNLLNL